MNLYNKTDLYKVMAEFLETMMDHSGFAEDFFFLNIRIVLVTVACALGGCSLKFLQFPDDQDKIIMAVGVYFVFAFVVFILDLHYTGVDCFLVIKTKAGERVHCSLIVDEFSSAIRFEVKGGKCPAAVQRDLNRR